LIFFFFFGFFSRVFCFFCSIFFILCYFFFLFVVFSFLFRFFFCIFFFFVFFVHPFFFFFSFFFFFFFFLFLSVHTIADLYEPTLPHFSVESILVPFDWIRVLPDSSIPSPCDAGDFPSSRRVPPSGHVSFDPLPLSGCEAHSFCHSYLGKKCTFQVEIFFSLPGGLFPHYADPHLFYGDTFPTRVRSQRFELLSPEVPWFVFLQLCPFKSPPSLAESTPNPAFLSGLLYVLGPML